MIREVVKRGGSSPSRERRGDTPGGGGYIDLKEGVEIKMRPFLVEGRDDDLNGEEDVDARKSNDGSSSSFAVVDWDHEEDLLARQAEATKAQMLKVRSEEANPSSFP